MLKCTFCNNKAIYRKKNLLLCEKHFIKYFEKKVLYTIKEYNLIKPKEKIGIAVSGGKDSISLLYLLNKYKKKLKIKIVGIHINEGISNYREYTTEHLKKISKKYSIPLKIYSFKEYFGYTLDEAVRLSKKYKPCTICGIWRRWLINYASKENKISKLATAHNLNDEAQTVIMNILDHNVKDLAKGGIYTGIKNYSGFVPRIKPFYFITEKEAMIYSILNNIQPPWTECKYIEGQFRDIVRSELYKLDYKYKNIVFDNIIKVYLKLLPKLKQSEKFKSLNLNPCIICGEPTSRQICRACEIKLELDKIKNNKD